MMAVYDKMNRYAVCYLHQARGPQKIQTGELIFITKLTLHFQAFINARMMPSYYSTCISSPDLPSVSKYPVLIIHV